MARKLPWADAHTRPPKRLRTTSVPRPIHAQRSDAGSDSDGLETVKLQKPPSTPARKRVTSRTPSTSPPPGPPTAGIMRRGYDRDDIYMMVEDEFQSVAQAFTAHLHHAEYKRLMKKAREAPPKVLPEPISPMGNETKKRLQRDALQSKQKKALAGLAGAGAEDDVESIDEGDDDRLDDPWAGTSLARLIGSGSQQKTSLIGLEKMTSGTRAAKGFARTEPSEDIKAKNPFERFFKPKDSDQPRRRIVLDSEARRVQHAKTMNDTPQIETKEREYSGNFRRFDDYKKDLRPNQRIKKEVVTPTKKDLMASNLLPNGTPSSSPSIKSVISKKRKQADEEDKEDRLDTVPLFIM